LQRAAGRRCRPEQSAKGRPADRGGATRPEPQRPRSGRRHRGRVGAGRTGTSKLVASSASRIMTTRRNDATETSASQMA